MPYITNTPGQVKCCGVYRIRNTSNGHVYIGSTSQTFNKRWNTHASYLRRNAHNNKPLQRAWEKHGEESFVFEVLEICDPRHRFDVEQVMIDFYRRINERCIYNTLMHAGSAKGYKHSPDVVRKLTGRKMSREAIEKCAAAKRGKPRPPETRKKLSEANMGKRQSPETIKKRADSLRGRKRSPETVEKVRRANTGKKRSPETRAKIAEAARNISDETRKKMSDAKKGKKRKPTGETRKWNQRSLF